MNKIVQLCFFTIFVLQVSSCSKPITIPRDQLYKLTVAKDPEAHLVIPGLGQGVKCTDYGPGCVGAHTVALKRVEMIAVEYDTEESAIKDAVRLNAYYIKNWIFDDVTDEPVLEKFVIEAYGAVNPNKVKKP
ncbi:MAG: hypothetical protein ACOYL6_18360 [Bacteriovoracaceae bacterium]